MTDNPITVKRCISVSRTWRMVLETGQHDSSTTVGQYMKLLQQYTDEMTHLFHGMNWEEQIQVAVGCHDYVWVSLLDSDQTAAYRITKD